MMKFGTLVVENGVAKEKDVREVDQNNLTCECWSVQLYGLSHCDECEFKDTDDCGGTSIRKTGKNKKGIEIPIN